MRSIRILKIRGVEISGKEETGKDTANGVPLDDDKLLQVAAA
jgi:hypothetical protein